MPTIQEKEQQKKEQQKEKKKEELKDKIAKYHERCRTGPKPSPDLMSTTLGPKDNPTSTKEYQPPVANFDTWKEQNSTIQASSDSLVELGWQIKAAAKDDRMRILIVDLGQKTMKWPDVANSDKLVELARGLSFTLKIVNGTIDLRGGYFIFCAGNSKAVVFEDVHFIGGWDYAAPGYARTPNSFRTATDLGVPGDSYLPQLPVKGTLHLNNGQFTFNNCNFTCEEAGHTPSEARKREREEQEKSNVEKFTYPYVLQFAVILQAKSKAEFKNCVIDHYGGIVVDYESSCVIKDTRILHRNYRDCFQIRRNSKLELIGCEVGPHGQSNVGPDLPFVPSSGSAVRFETGCSVTCRSCFFSSTIGPCIFYDGGSSDLLLEDCVLEGPVSEASVVTRLKACAASSGQNDQMNKVTGWAPHLWCDGSCVLVLEPWGGSASLQRCTLSQPDTHGVQVMLRQRPVGQGLRWKRTPEDVVSDFNLSLTETNIMACHLGSSLSIDDCTLPQNETRDLSTGRVKALKHSSVNVSVASCRFDGALADAIHMSKEVGGKLTVVDSQLYNVGGHVVVTHHPTVLTNCHLGYEQPVVDELKVKPYDGDVVAHVGADVEMTKCMLHGDADVGLEVKGKLKAVECEVVDKAQYGVRVTGGGAVQLNKVLILRSGTGGLVVEDKGSRAEAVSCRIARTHAHHVRASNGARVLCERCEFEKSIKGCGLEVKDVGTAVVVKDSVITSNSKSNIMLSKSASLELVNTTISGSLTGCGVEVAGLGCGFRAEGCKVTGNAMSGIFIISQSSSQDVKDLVITPTPPRPVAFEEGGKPATPPELKPPGKEANAEFWEIASHKATLSGCELAYNMSCGLLVVGNTCEVLCHTCTVTDNRRYAFQVDKGAVLRLVDVTAGGSTAAVLLKPTTKAFLHRCTLKDSRDVGMYLADDCTASLSSCKIQGVGLGRPGTDPDRKASTTPDNSVNGPAAPVTFGGEGLLVVGRRSAAKLSATKVWDTEGNGIALLEGAVADLKEVVVSGSRKASALFVTGMQGKATAVGCVFKESDDSCVLVEGGAEVHLTGCDLLGSVTKSSLQVHHQRSHASVMGGSVSGSKGSGVLAEEEGVVVMDGTKVHASKTQFGIKALGRGSSITAKSCDMQANAGGNAAAQQGATVSLTGCVASGSSLGPGLMSKGAGSDLTAYQCKIKDNGVEGVQALAGGSVKVLDSEISGNGRSAGSQPLDVRVQDKSSAFIKNCSFGAGVKDPNTRCWAADASSLKLVTL